MICKCAACELKRRKEMQNYYDWIKSLSPEAILRLKEDVKKLTNKQTLKK